MNNPLTVSLPISLPGSHGSQPVDLDDPALYINRELSWLEFNHRVLEEAMDTDAPLLERLKFLAIVSSNLDEFFMVRVAGLRRQGKSETVQRGPDGLSAEEQLRAIAARCHQIVNEQYRCWKKSVLPGLARHGIVHRKIADLSPEQSRWVSEFYHQQVFPVLTPLALDPSHPFPHLRNRSLNLVVTLRKGKGGDAPPYYAVVQVPGVLPRLVKVPGDGFQFVLLEDIICAQMSELFQGLHVTGSFPFRITRDSDLNFDEEEVEDLLERMEQEVRKREWGDAVRLEVSAHIGNKALRQLIDALPLTEQDIYRIDGPVSLTDFMALLRIPDHAELHDPPFVPPVIRRLQGQRDLFAEIREGDLLLHHPFESFSSVVEFVQQAAEDPDVLAIKQTLYRTSGDSAIIAALTRAAQNGKQVTALVELKARFDEENNIGWARALEKAGVHVVYGLVGLKIHCKVLLVVRREPGEERLRRYVHLGTGNYHPATARLYTDLGLLTCSLRFGQDVSRLFNVLTGYSRFPQWRKLSVAPVGLRERILELIDLETQTARLGREGRIIVQINSLVDPEVIRALYRASMAGVTVDLIVRGICCLRARVPGVSDNVRVISIIGRFLEHQRVFYFRHGGDDLVFLSSGDWMPRNLSRRVETMFPVEDPILKKRVLEDILQLRLKDNVKARELGPDGEYRRLRSRRGHPRVDSQTIFMERSLQSNVPEPEQAFGVELLVHSASDGEPEEPMRRATVLLAGRFPVRQAPPELPHDGEAPADPLAPDPERNGAHAGDSSAFPATQP